MWPSWIPWYFFRMYLGCKGDIVVSDLYFFAHVLFHCHGQRFGIFITVTLLWHSMVPYDSDCVSLVFCNDHIHTCHITRPSVAAFVLLSPSLVHRSLSLSWPATCGYLQLVLRLSSYVQSIAIHCRQPSESLNSYLLIFQAPLGLFSCCCLVHCYVSCHWIHTLAIEFITITINSYHNNCCRFFTPVIAHFATKQRKGIGICLFLGWTFVSFYDTKCCWICTHSYLLADIYSWCGMNLFAIYLLYKFIPSHCMYKFISVQIHTFLLLYELVYCYYYMNSYLFYLYMNSYTCIYVWICIQ